MSLAWLRRRHSRDAAKSKGFEPVSPSSPVSTRQMRVESFDTNLLLDDLPGSLSPRPSNALPQIGAKPRKAVKDAVTKSAQLTGAALSAFEDDAARSAPIHAVRAKTSVSSNDVNRKSRRLSLPSAPPPMYRQLSFTDDDFGEITKAIAAEEPHLNWLEDLWALCLAEKPSSATKSLAFKSLSGWVEVFNRWQALGTWSPGRAPEFVDSDQLQGLTGAPHSRLAEWMKVFGEKSKNGKVSKVHMPAFLCTCIVFSSAISKKQKIRFLLGVFDENDNLAFEEDEFVSFVCAFFRGMALAFGFSQQSKELQQASQQLAKHFYARIAARTPLDQSIQFASIEAWILGRTGDPLAVPFAMLLERYSSRGAEDDPEHFLDADAKFRLSHRRPVDPPAETANVLDRSFLQRREIKVIQEVFNHCQENFSFDIQHSEAERVIQMEIEPELWCKKLARGLEHAELLRQTGKKISLPVFLKQICPRADQRHLQMFQSWLQELQEQDALRAQLLQSQEMLRKFKNWRTLPVLTAAQSYLLSRDYEFLQESSSHSLDCKALLAAPPCMLLFETEMCEDRIKSDEVAALMCPSDLRPTEANPSIDEVVFNFLSLRVLHQTQELEEKDALFEKAKTVQALQKSFYKPLVPADMLQTWQQFLDCFDDNTQYVTLKQMLRSGLVCPDVAEFMCEQIGAFNGMTDRFSRQDFLAEMTSICGFRP